MEWVVILGLAFLLLKSGALANLGLGIGYTPPPTGVAPQTAAQISAGINAQTQQDSQIAAGTIQGGTVAATSALNAVGASSGALAAVPVIGAAFSILANTLIAASKKRAQEAQSENQAVANGLPGWDQAVAQVVAGYNNGSLTVTQVQTLLQTVMANFWNETVPQIQPGRNGCAGGASCPGSVAPNSGSAYATTAPSSYCSGSIGAACCVGCADLQLSVDNMEWAVAHADSTGQPASAFVQTVYASKYGGVNRPSYLVTFRPPVTTVPV